MKISIVIISKYNQYNLEITLESILNQTHIPHECLVLSNFKLGKIKDTFSIRLIDIQHSTCIYDDFNYALQSLTGDYVLFLNEGDKLSNDRVLEEFLLNSPTEDIIFTNTIIAGDVNVAEKHIFIPDKIRISDLAIKEQPVQNTFYKCEILIDNHGFDISFPNEAARFFNIKMINNHHATYRHINFFASTIINYNINTVELEVGLKQYLPSLAEDMMELMQHRLRNEQESTNILFKLEKTLVFKKFIKLRKFAELKGFYKLKAKMKQKSYYKKISKRDEKLRNEVEKKIWALPINILSKKNDNTDIIVSLTTYGHRVIDTAPYSIYTLFTQKILPNRIILFLDRDNWNEKNIPPLLRRLQQSGLEIEFCEDLKPYKKLIPALGLYPENIIITVDDDVYYNENTLYELLDTYEKSDKKSVICHWAFVVERRNNQFIPYSLWKDNKYGNEHSFFSAIGQDGVLYPPNIFDQEIFKSEVFMKLCTNDDVWFWIQEFRNNINVRIVSNSSKENNRFVNTLDQWSPTKKSALYYLNDILGMNNINLNNLLVHYNLK